MALYYRHRATTYQNTDMDFIVALAEGIDQLDFEANRVSCGRRILPFALVNTSCE